MKKINRRVPEENKTPSELYPKVAEYERKLNNLIRETLDVGKDMLSINEGKIYMPDLFIIGVLNRSINLIDAILCLTNRWNFIAAGPLVRLHLDTLLRLSYLRATKNPDLFILYILEDKQINKFKDDNGKNLTDCRLRDYARPLFPQIDNVYMETSKLIHFSDKHMLSSTMALDTKDKTTGFFIGKGFLRWPENDIIALLTCTISVTEVILAITRGWILQKAKKI